MLVPVVRQMAALAESGEVAQVVVARVVIEMRGRQHYAGEREGGSFRPAQQYLLRGSMASGSRQPADTPTAVVAPAAAVLVPP